MLVHWEIPNFKKLQTDAYLLIKLLCQSNGASNNRMLSWFPICSQDDIYKFLRLASILYKQPTSNNHIQYCQYHMHITRYLDWPCPRSWHTNQICSWFCDWTKPSGPAYSRSMLDCGEWDTDKCAWSCKQIMVDYLWSDGLLYLTISWRVITITLAQSLLLWIDKLMVSFGLCFYLADKPEHDA